VSVKENMLRYIPGGYQSHPPNPIDALGVPDLASAAADAAADAVLSPLPIAFTIVNTDLDLNF